MAPPGDEGRSYGLRWTVEERSGLATLRLFGDLDLAAADDLVSTATPLLATGSVLVFDLGELAFMDSTGLRVLASLKRDADRNGRRFLLGRLSPAARRVLHIAGLLDHFEYVEEPPTDEVLCRTCDAWGPAGGTRCLHCGGDL